MIVCVGQDPRPLNTFFNTAQPTIFSDARHGQRMGDVAQLVERRTGTQLTGLNSRCGKGCFFPRVSFQCRLSYGVRTTPCANACINICAHVKDPVVHVGVWWIMEKLKHPACTVGWVARLCHSWLSPGKATRISHGRNPTGTVQYDYNITTQGAELRE